MNKRIQANIIDFYSERNEKLFELADFHHERGEYKEAFDLFQKAAENGETSCMLNLANMYVNGEGTIMDYDKALEWELKADKAGDTAAAINIGITYRLKGDIRNSKKWFEKSYKSGDGSAALELAKLYSVSEKEKETIKFYLRKALASNDLCESDIDLANELLSVI